MSKKGATDGFREVSASGSHFQIGETLGKQCRDQAIRMEKQFKEAISAVPGWSVDKMISYSRKSLPLSKRFYPEYIEELEGYARGSGVKFEVLYAMSCDAPIGRGKGCTDLVANGEWTKDDCVYAAHNEDVSPGSINEITIARIKPKDEPGYLGMNYGGIWPTAGMNAAGISLTGNALVPNDTRQGIPKIIPCRKVLRETGIYQALMASMPEGRGHSFNNIVTDANGEIFSMEGSATTFDALYGEEGWLVHTNHYLSPRMWKFEENMHTRFSSIVRYNRAKKLFKKELGNVDIASFHRIFSDHVGYPESICRHPDAALAKDEQTRSIFSVVFNLTEKVAWVCYGNPCEGAYKKYEF